MIKRAFDSTTAAASTPLKACSSSAEPAAPHSENRAKSDSTMMNKSPSKDIAAFAELVAIQPLTQKQYKRFRSFVQMLAISSRLGTPLPHSGEFDLPLLAGVLLTFDVCIAETEDGDRLSFRQAYGSLEGAFFLPPGKAFHVEQQIHDARGWLRSNGIKHAMQAVGKLQAEFAEKPKESRDELTARLTQLTAKLMSRIPNPE